MDAGPRHHDTEAAPGACLDRGSDNVTSGGVDLNGLDLGVPEELRDEHRLPFVH
ncbi:hypothetical protein AB0B66_39100 [Catellatospora sp. NPDC049111]|uniref:hypothetical protein n=1 Tax=Catellatospora sp. NPDC049111 TaxID=3155271 RepID=UPI0033EA1ABA